MAGAGEVYEVFGTLRYAAKQACPKSLEGTVCKLKSKDGEVFEIPTEAACTSGRVKTLVMTGGVEDEIPFPLGKDVMTKVVEYMKYHKDHPCFEIRTPLESENLVECGASKWDMTFVKVDKDKLFDLLLAASVLDISSLFFLASSQLAINFKDKTGDRLRKEFNLSNDLTPDEEEMLKSAFMAIKTKKKQQVDEEVDELAQSAAMLNGVAVSAEKQGVLLKQGEAGIPTVSFKSWRAAQWRALILLDWTKLESAPSEIKSDKDLVLAALMSSNGAALKYASQSLKADADVVLEAVKYTGAALAEAAPALRSDADFVAKAVAISGSALEGAQENLKSDPSFVLKVTNTGGGSALKGASTGLKSDMDFMLKAVAKDAEAYKFADPELQKNFGFAEQCAVTNGLSLQYMPSVFKADAGICTTAINENALASAFAHSARRAELNLSLPTDGKKAVSTFDNFSTIGQKAELAPMGMQIAAYAAEDQYNPAWFLKGQKMIQYSASSTMSANMGQANYIASNAYMDKLPFYERPEHDSVTIMWGAVGNIGMRWKAFASADFLNATPESLLGVADCCKILHVTLAKMDPPEWYNCQFYDQYTREAMLRPTAGFGSGGGWKPGEAMQVYPTKKDTTMEQPDVEAEPWRAEGLKKGFLQGKGLKDSRVKEDIEGLEDVPSCPLGGWPGLLKSPTEALPPRLAMPFIVGATVRLVGMESKTGQQGTLVKQHRDGKWKVALADQSGHALLKSSNLQVIANPGEAIVDMPLPPEVKKTPAVKKGGLMDSAADEAARKEAAAERIAKAAQRREQLVESMQRRQQAAKPAKPQAM